MFTGSGKLTVASWYGIHQTDAEGKLSYSTTVQSYCHHAKQDKRVPNPVRNVATLTVSSKLLNKTAMLTDMNGKHLQTIKNQQFFSYPAPRKLWSRYLLVEDRKRSLLKSASNKMANAFLSNA